MARLDPSLQFIDRDERLLGRFKSRERLRRWYELQAQERDKESNG